MGWQRQPNGGSIQEAVEAALGQLLGGVRVRVDATGRTDAGVHALHQVVGFVLEVPRTARALERGLNALLPRDISCLGVRPAPDGFSPRHWTRSKHYRYRLLLREARCPFRAGWTWHQRAPLDVPSMSVAAAALVGRHDFSSFRAAGCSALHAVRTLARSEITRGTDDELHLDFHGNGFLRHQVRIMVGTLVEVGQGRREPASVRATLAACDRAAAGPTAPPHGLWLVRAEVGDAPRAPDATDPGSAP